MVRPRSEVDRRPPIAAEVDPTLRSGALDPDTATRSARVASGGIFDQFESQWIGAAPTLHEPGLWSSVA